MAKVSKLKGKKISLYRRTIGVVYQEYKILPKKNVFENIAFALEVTEHNKNDVLGDKDYGATVTYNPETQTLTLNNAVIPNGKKINKEGTYQAFWAGIYTTINLNIQLNGNNSIGEIDETK